MRFGLALPHYDFSLPSRGPIDRAVLKDWAQRADEMGFDSLWVSDHLFFDLSVYGGRAARHFAMECFTTLAVLTQWTRRARLGALVVANGLRHPSLVAKMAATLSAFSRGRFDLGMGAGWYRPEFDASGVPFPSYGSRIDKLTEAVQIVRGMFSNPSFSFEGDHYRVRDVWTVPQPASLSVWVGGKGNRPARVAGRFADGFNTAWRWTPAAYADRVRLVDESARSAGRDPRRIKKSVGLLCLPALDGAGLEARWAKYLANTPPGIGSGASLEEWRKDKLAGTPEEIAARIEEFRASGAEEVILSFGLIPFQVCDASAVEDFVREVRPLVESRD